VAVCAFISTIARTEAQTAADLHALRAAAPPKLDGVLDEPIWTTTPQPLDRWVSYNPLRGEPAQQQTHVWIAYDDAAIYFAFRCLDPEPEKIRTTITRRDNAWNDDWVAVSLDSSRAGQVAYHMFVNPSGIQMDGLNSGSNGEDMAPDWVWQSAGRVDDRGYAVEMRVPLESLRFRSGSAVRMGVMFFRRNSRLGISWSWPEMVPGTWVFETHVPVVFGELRQPRLFEVIPSVTFSANRTRAVEDLAWQETNTDGDLGASVKYGLTSTVTLDATVNPDFSQVESDAFEVEVNQRFPVFFSEKRPFFMEGLGLFNLAGAGGDSTMRTAVHTRRIIDPSVGVKLTGTAGRQTFALLSSADAAVPGGRKKAYTIGRAIHNFGQGQYVGALATDTELGAEHNRVAGGDFLLRHGQSFTWNGSILYADTRLPTGEAERGIGTQASYTYSTRRVTMLGQVEHYDRGFHMDTAFINRVGVTRGWQYQEVQFYPDEKRHGWIKRVAPFLWVMRAEDRVQGGPEHFVLPGLRFNFTRQGSLRIDFGRGAETFAGRRFTTGRAHVDGGAQITRWLNFNLSFQRGPGVFYDAVDPFSGTSAAFGVRADLQPNTKLSHRIGYTFVEFERDTGEQVFDLHIVNLRNTYQFNPQFLLRAIVQFDSAERRVLGDFLASYELAPGTVVHAGYGTLLGDPERRRYLTTAHAVFFKASYLARF
jgi:hypothetical protein